MEWLLISKLLHSSDLCLRQFFTLGMQLQFPEVAGQGFALFHMEEREIDRSACCQSHHKIFSLTYFQLDKCFVRCPSTWDFCMTVFHCLDLFSLSGRKVGKDPYLVGLFKKSVNIICET